ncbi:hypothetical protein [Accumulibacter sp.]|uniref:hypothetical protein n=1 Tax=Accumulibacter sp. TaxID=2053492 RepID=UPI002D1FA56A|nr:hypothetical protein [Accumulibacter sp.]
MRLAAAHRLSEQKGAGLVAATFQASEGFLEQNLHPVGDEVLLEEPFAEPFAVSVAFEEVGQVEDDVAAVAVEYARARRAMGLESHRRRFLSCCFPVSSAILRDVPEE